MENNTVQVQLLPGKTYTGRARVTEDGEFSFRPYRETGKRKTYMEVDLGNPCKIEECKKKYKVCFELSKPLPTITEVMVFADKLIKYLIKELF